jgi:hypothetical protein
MSTNLWKTVGSIYKSANVLKTVATFNNISVISGLPVNGCFPDAAVVYVVSVQ